MGMWLRARHPGGGIGVITASDLQLIAELEDLAFQRGVTATLHRLTCPRHKTDARDCCCRLAVEYKEHADQSRKLRNKLG